MNVHEALGGRSAASSWLAVARRAAGRPKKWDVTADLGPTQKLAFDTSEGTWMNVDVSPDGRTGRLRPARRHLHDADRRIGIVAGDAHHERAGVRHAAALQSRRQADRDRQRPRRPVEHLDDRRGREERRGRSRARSAGSSTARRGRPTAATSSRGVISSRERSLGAGEIWMFHASGSDGLQVTEKNGFQKDAGEPALSPDGRYLYYSKDVTPGQQFEYNKDPNGTIYAIVRRDLNTGRERTACRRPGRLGDAARQPGRQVARLRPPRAHREQALRPRSRRRAAIAPSSITSTRTCRKRGRSTGSTRSTPGCPTARRS